MHRRTVVFLTLVLATSILVISAAPAAGESAFAGVSVTLPEDSEAEYLDEAETYADRLGLDMASNATSFSTMSGGAYIVVTDTTPKTGQADVTGQEIAPPGDGTFGLIFASNVEYDTTGTPVDLDELDANPTAYENQFVAVDGGVRQFAYTMDAGNEYIVQTSSMTLGSEQHQRPLLHSPGRVSRGAVRSLSQDEQGASSQLTTQPGIFAPGVGTGQYAWSGQGNATVHAVIDPMGGEYGLYVSYVDYHATSVDDLDSLDSHRGDVVRFEATGIGTRLSSQEAIIQAARCAPSSATFPPTGCIPIPADSVIHAGVAFDGVPKTTAETVIYVGASNAEQSDVATTERGRYQFTGRVVNASVVDPSLTGTAVVIYDRERLGDLDTTRQAIETARERKERVKTQLEDQLTTTNESWAVEGTSAAVQTEAQQTPTPTPTPTPTSTPQPSPNTRVLDVAVTQTQIEPDQSTAIKATVKNDGGRGQTTVSVDTSAGQISKSVHIDANTQTVVTLGFSPDQPGEYRVYHDGSAAATVTVGESAEGPGPLSMLSDTLPWVAGALFSLGYLVVYLYAISMTVAIVFDRPVSTGRFASAWAITGVGGFAASAYPPLSVDPTHLSVWLLAIGAISFVALGAVETVKLMLSAYRNR